MSEERMPAGEPPELDDLDLDDEPEQPEDDDTELDDGEPAAPVEPGEGEEPQPQARQPSRAEQRIRALRRQAKEQGDELRRLREMVTRPPAQQAPQPDPGRQAELDRAERERVSQMPFEEQGQYWARKSEERIQQQILRSNLETRDFLDRQTFKQLMREKALPSRYETEVETLLSQARQQGMNPSRDWLLNAVIGKEVLDKKERETERQRVRGQRRIASQTTRPGGAQSTAASPSGRRSTNSNADLDARLRGITIGEFTNLMG